MSPAALSPAGVLLITVPTIAFGGVSLLSFLMRPPATSASCTLVAGGVRS